MRIGRIYKIVAGQTDECYVGSTFQELRYRFREHKLRFNENRKRLTTSSLLFQKHGVENCSILLIKEYMVTDRKHLEVYETLWMKKLRSINKIEPSGGLLNHYYKKQWREKNKENIRKYRVDNAEHIRECTKKYKERNAEHIKETTKKWREANVEKRREDLKQWRLVNGDKEKARKREKVECDCGLKTSRCGIARHKRTKRHMELMNAKTQ